MKRLKLRTRFFLYHTGIILLIMIGLVGYIYKVVVAEMKLEDEQHFQLIAQKSTSQIDSFYHGMEHMAMQIAMNPKIIEIFQNMSKEQEINFFEENPREKETLQKLLETYDINTNSGSKVILYNQWGDLYYFSDTATEEKNIQEFFQQKVIFQENIGEVLQEKNSSYQKSSVYREPGKNILEPENTDDFVAAVRCIKNNLTNQTYGYVEVWEPVSHLEKMISDIGEENYLNILQSDSNVIYTSPQKPKEGYRGDIYRLTLPLEHAPYQLEFYKRPLRIQGELHRFYVILTAIVVAILAAVFSWERVMFRYFSKPLKTLDHSIKSVAIDKLSVEIVDENSEDLIISLENSFNTMLQHLKISMQRQFEAKHKEAKAHLFALQSQMNPHFLHNMLAIISMEAQLDDNKKIPTICKELGGILRYNSEMGDGFSTIRKECENSESYMLLMKVRYEELFEYEIQVEPEVCDIKIPKLIVQPFCENCFKHGFKKVEPVWNIRIRAWMQREKWYIQIQDNGCGFSQEFLESFQQFTENIHEKEVDDILNSISIGGLCIPNIYTRMNLIYGENFVFVLKNHKKGAYVLLGGNLDD